MLRQKWQKWQRSYPPRERTAGVLVDIEDSVDLGSCWEPRYWLGSSFVDNFYVDLEVFWTQPANQYPNITAILLLFILCQSQRYVLGWAGPPCNRPHKRIITLIYILVGLLCISLLVTVVGRRQRYDFIWFSPHNLYVRGVSWSFGMGILLGPPMDQRGSRRVCGRIWLRSAGLWEFLGASCRWSVVMAGVNQSAVILSI